MWDPQRQVTITHALLKDGADYTPYEGIEVTGWPVRTMVRGRTVVRDGALVGARDFGTHLTRGKPFTGTPWVAATSARGHESAA